jgi:RNA polymerase sigma factor (sigma-70 family)
LGLEVVSMEESYLFYRNIWVKNFLDGFEQMKLLDLLDGADEDLVVNIVKRLTLANIGLVHRAVKEFMIRNDRIPYEDLMSLGILGTMNAIEKYDSSKGIKLSTFIYACVKRSLKEFEKENSAVNIEKHFYNKISSYNKCLDQYYVKNGNNPSLKYIKDNTGLSDVDILLIQTTHTDFVSLSEPLDDDLTLMDCIESDASSIQQIIELKELKGILRKNLLKLSDVEIKILCCRYGLGSSRAMTQEEVAKMMNCSHQNVSRLERKALTKLRGFKELRKAYYA